VDTITFESYGGVISFGCRTTSRQQPLKRKLKRVENFHIKYREFMQNLFQKGYVRKMTEEEAVG